MKHLVIYRKFLIFLIICEFVSANIYLTDYKTSSDSKTLISNNSFQNLNDIFTNISVINDPQDFFIISFDNSSVKYSLLIPIINIFQSITVSGVIDANKTDIDISNSFVLTNSNATLKFININFNVMSQIVNNTIFDLRNSGNLILQVKNFILFL